MGWLAAADGRRRLVLAGGLVADGLGHPLTEEDVLVEDGRISAVGPRGAFSSCAAEVVALPGRVVAPGFIDVHSHADNAPLLPGGDTTKILQGVTTEVVGNCGLSLAPVAPQYRGVLSGLLSRVFPTMNLPWGDAGELFDALDGAGYITNYATLIGHNTLRTAVMGGEARPSTKVEVQQMRELLDRSLEAGGIGLSSGLFYSPGMFAESSELTAVAAGLGAGRVYATHMRDEAGGLMHSIGEALDVAESTGCRLQISHLKAAGKPNWGRAPQALELLAHARERGIQVTQDVYPYDAASTTLASCLPGWCLEGDNAAVLRRLRDPVVRGRIRAEVDAGPSDAWENPIAGAGWKGILISSTPDHEYEGRTLDEIGCDLGIDPFDALVLVLIQEELRALMVIFDMCDRDVETIMQDPFTMIGSDGLPPGGGGRPHPRLTGTFPRVLGLYVRERSVLTLQQAIAKMTSLPASTFGLRDRGTIQAGRVADLVVFSPRSVRDVGTYTEPNVGPEGIDLVLVAGQPVVRDGQWLGNRVGTRIGA